MKDVLCKIWKRVMDVCGSLIGLIVFSPLMFIISLYIKIVSPGPILFRHQRVGLYGKKFDFFKFRTMKPGSNQDFHKNHVIAMMRSGEKLQKLDDKGDSRIIFGGRFLRKTCFDELPQLFNVLRGEMSLVGPRPCMEYEAAEYSDWHRQRLLVMPGMTGLWQVSGKTKLDFEEMVSLDILYSQNVSFLFDLKILFLTVPAILTIVFERSMKRARLKIFKAGESIKA